MYVISFPIQPICLEFLHVFNVSGIWEDISKTQSLNFYLKATLVHKWKGLTNESDGGVKTGSDVSSQVVLHGETQVLKLPFVDVWTGGGHVEHGCDSCSCQSLSAGRVDGAAQKQEGKQLHWAILQFYAQVNLCAFRSWLMISHQDSTACSPITSYMYICLVPDHMRVYSGPSLVSLVPLLWGDCWQDCNKTPERSWKISQIHLKRRSH